MFAKLQPASELLPDGKCPRIAVFQEGALEPAEVAIRSPHDQILVAVGNNLNVCAAFSGHPGIGVYPAYRALQLAKARGFQTKMFPAVSAIDCLFADLGVDPANGCQLFEAETLLDRNYHLDPQSCVILFQVGVIGVRRHTNHGKVRIDGVERLTRFLRKYYPSDHEAVVYEAATLPILPPRIDRVQLSLLPKVTLTPISTLYVPPR